LQLTFSSVQFLWFNCNLYVNLNLTYNFMNYSIKYYPEKRNGIVENVPVMLSVTFKHQRMFYYTGLRCNIAQWDPDKNKLKINQVTPDGATSQRFNADLNNFTKIVNDLFLRYEVEKIVPDPAKLRNDLKFATGKTKVVEDVKAGFFDLFDKYIVDADLSPGRKKHLHTTSNKVRAFKKDTTFDNLDVQYLTDFQNFLLDTCKISKNTAISELRRLRAFFGHAIKHGWTTNYPFKSFTIEAESFGDPVYITIEERDILFTAKIRNASLARVRDIFVFQCLIGCRVGDLIKLEKSNIIDGCIEYIAAKTKDDRPRIARVPLTSKAQEILSRYDLPGGALLPFIAPQKYNERIKELFRYCGITRTVTIPDKKTRENKQVSIADIAASHMARAVFCGSLFHKGVKDSIIGSMSGHVDGSKAFVRYRNIEKSDQQNAMKLIE